MPCAKAIRVGKKRPSGAVRECVRCGYVWVSRPRVSNQTPRRCPNRACTAILQRDAADRRTRLGQLAALGVTLGEHGASDAVTDAA